MSVGASGIYSEAQALSRHVESAPHRVADGRPGPYAQGEPRRDAYVLVEQTRRETVSYEPRAIPAKTWRWPPAETPPAVTEIRGDVGRLAR